MITLKNIEIRRGSKVLLQQANVSINPGEKIGLVGRNGAGKSSLFALFNGELHEDSGEFFIPGHWRMAQVAQHMPETAQSASLFVLEGDTRLAELNEQLTQAEASGDGMRMAQLHADLHDAGQHDALARAESLILGLGFAADQLERPVNSFSGGWRMRLQLARALMCPSELLLLDEPTNHLDLDALVWLEDWLQRYEGTMLVISHDREFLDAVTRVTLHIELGQLTRYGGNYSAFELLRAQQLSLQQAALSKQQDKMAHLQKFIDRFKAKASKAKQAQSRVKALERMEKIGPILAQADFNFEFKEPDNLPNPMLSLRDARFGYTPEAGDPAVILQGVSRTVLAGQRIGILGANGQGKSTLIKTIARTLGVLGGEVTEGKGLRIGYFAQQELDVLRTDEDPLAHMVRLARELGLQGSPGSREQDLRGFLGGFNFSGDMVKQAVGTMSGGEKARLVLAMLVWQRPNLLLLDEPTNHLDLATREALAMALNSFEGTLMLVSHDRALLRAVCDDFWLVGRGAVKDFDGDLEDYQRYLLDEAKRQRDALRDKNKVQKPASAPRASGAEQRKRQAQERQAQLARLRPVRKALEQAEQHMAQLQQDQQRLELRMAAAPSPADLAEVGKQLKTTTDALAQAEEHWLELSEQLQAMEASEAV